MSDVFTNRAGPASATHPGKPEGTRMLCDTKTEPMAKSSWNGTRSEQGRGKGVGGEGSPQEPARIRIDVPVGTSYLEIQASIFRQAWQLTGTQLRAAIALDITPDTISRVLRRCDRLGIGCPKVLEAWPVVAPVNRVIGSSGHRAIDGENQLPDHADREIGRSGEQIDRLIELSGHRVIDSENQPPDPAISDDRVKDGQNPSSVALTPCENDESGPSPNDQHELKTED